MVQEVILALLFVGALAFIGRMIYRNIRGEAECTGDGCPKCSPQKTQHEKA